MSSSEVIQIQGLRKSYGAHEAVRGIDLTVHRGEIFAFLGPNGAGKTTTVEILEGFRRASAGQVSVLGEDPARAGARWRERIGIVLQESEPEGSLTASECLTLYAGYYSRPRDVAETLELVGLTEQAGQRAAKLSGGQRRRLDVALALIGDGELIFLDEPTTGFDPSARRASWDVISGLRDLGKTVFLTTHYMEEAERLADRIAVIARGEIVAEGTPQTLGGRDTRESVITFSVPPEVAPRSLPDGLGARLAASSHQKWTLTSGHPAQDLNALTGWALANGIALSDLQVSRPTLEDVYLSLTTTDEGARPDGHVAVGSPSKKEEVA